MAAWAEGGSAGTIGKSLGISRSVVLGIVARAREKGDVRAAFRFSANKKDHARLAGSAGGKALRTTITPRRKPHPADRAMLRLVASFDDAHVGPHAATVTDIRTSQCRYPVRGWGVSMLMCGERCGSALHSYCAGHMAMAYRTARVFSEAAE